MTIWCAEIGSNHNGDLNRTKELIQTAKNLGCDYVKFQLFKAEKLYDSRFTKQIEQTKKRELPIGFLPEIKEECIKQNIKFACTPFDLNSVEILEDFVDIFKIGSYELLYEDLFNEVISSLKPWMFSIGMVENIEIIHKYLRNACYLNNPPKYILHCNSNYPAIPENCNLANIHTLDLIVDTFFIPRKQFKKSKIGWSDHTVSDEIIMSAIFLKSDIIEFHLDLEDKKGFEFVHGHCWTPSKFERLKNRIEFLNQIDNKYHPKDEWLYSSTNQDECKKWRMDPEDGKRPLIKYREELLK